MFAQRNPQPSGAKGSLKWIQRLAGNSPLLTDAVRAAASRDADWDVEWVSPREDDDWAEYRDAGFLTRVRQPGLVPELEAYWPLGGPQWDGLGRSSTGVVLVEAKAHVAELASSCGAGGNSLKMIEAALAETKKAYGIPEHHDWLRGFYQYANRLAHLRFLKDRGVDALMVFLYFLGDSDVAGPASKEDWERELVPVYDHLGLMKGKQIEGVASVFMPVALLSP